jgi:adenosylhomocysteine nucleosidase
MTRLVVAALEEEVAEIRRRRPATDILVTGPGKVLAGAALGLRLGRVRPDDVLVVGTAGALDARLSGVLEIASVAQHDFDSDTIAALVGRTFGAPIVLQEHGVHLATGDVFLSDPAHVRRLSVAGFGLVDMEGYAYAYVCASAAVPLRIVKAVSDAADDDAGSTWVRNVSRCAVQLADWYDVHVALPDARSH